MAFTDINLVKLHCRVDADDDDALVGAYLASAEQSVVDYIQRPVYPVGSAMPADGDPGYSPYQMIVADPIVHAVLLLVAANYDDRDGQADEVNAVLPRPVRALLAPYRVWHPEVEDGDN